MSAQDAGNQLRNKVVSKINSLRESGNGNLANKIPEPKPPTGKYAGLLLGGASYSSSAAGTLAEIQAARSEAKAAGLIEKRNANLAKKDAGRVKKAGNDLKKEGNRFDKYAANKLKMQANLTAQELATQHEINYQKMRRDAQEFALETAKNEAEAAKLAEDINLVKEQQKQKEEFNNQLKKQKEGVEELKEYLNELISYFEAKNAMDDLAEEVGLPEVTDEELDSDEEFEDVDYAESEADPLEYDAEPDEEADSFSDYAEMAEDTGMEARDIGSVLRDAATGRATGYIARIAGKTQFEGGDPNPFSSSGASLTPLQAQFLNNTTRNWGSEFGSASTTMRVPLSDVNRIRATMPQAAMPQAAPVAPITRSRPAPGMEQGGPTAPGYDA